MQKFDLAVLQREPSLGAVGILSPNEMLMRSPVVSLQDAAALTCFRSVSRRMRGNRCRYLNSLIDEIYTVYISGGGGYNMCLIVLNYKFYTLIEVNFSLIC